MASIQTVKNVKSTTFRVQYMRDGFRVSKSFKTKKEAKEFESHLILNDDFAESLTNPTLTRFPLKTAIEEYLSQYSGRDDSVHQRMQYWSSALGDKPVGKITKRMIRTKLKELEDSGLKPATLNRYKSAIGSVYKYLSSEYYINHNPTKGIPAKKEDNARTRFLSKEELSRLLESARESKWDRLYLLILMAITTGARRSEMLQRKWEDIDLKARVIPLEQTKNGDRRVLTLTNGVITELMKFREPNGYVFPHSSKINDYFKGFDYHWKAALKDAGIEDFRFHDLRHSCASWLAMNGASLLEIADVLGHKSMEMTKRYSHLCTSHKAELTDRIFGDVSHG